VRTAYSLQQWFNTTFGAVKRGPDYFDFDLTTDQ